jgi:hypothetical protein
LRVPVPVPLPLPLRAPLPALPPVPLVTPMRDGPAAARRPFTVSSAARVPRFAAVRLLFAICTGS